MTRLIALARLPDFSYLRRRWIVVLGAVAATAAAGVYAMGRLGTQEPYLTAPIRRGDIVSVVTATGTVTPVGQVKVGSQLSGQIAELLVDFNDEVGQGQPLARLDAQAYRANVRQAEAAREIAEANMLMQEAALDKAESDLATARASRAVGTAETQSIRAQREQAEREATRLRALAQQAAISGNEVDRAQARAATARAQLRAAENQELVRDATARSTEAEVNMAAARLQNAVAEVKRTRAVLERAQVDLERTTITSPIDGVVIGRNVDSGQTVAVGLEAPTLFTLAHDLRRMEVYAQIDQADIGRIAAGQSVAFAVDAYPDRAFGGTVRQIRKSPQIVQNVVTYTVIVSADNPDLLLLPGMTAVLRITVAEKRDVLKVPNAALRFRPTRSVAASVEALAANGRLGVPQAGAPALVWLLQGGKLDGRLIGVGAGDANESVVLSGPIEAGSTVVIGTAAASDGAFGLRLGF